MVWVIQYRVALVSSTSRENRRSTSPPQSLQSRNFSTIHASRPTGESLSEYARLWGRVDWRWA